ncbi:hypothetical protein GCM10025876_03730 [Demequina litorisediminis]|uniref:Uncharacterized protein n=1 Tax=Demequina litorisediminis TaxID=1849022 RepID=A0ABQ6IBQ5_9MICO|nr:hypothetical protein GCM10025876_03730 [Demequina litorisediminis]
MRKNLGLVETLGDLRALLDALPLDQPYPGEGAEGPRGRQGTPKSPSCPEGWLDTQDITSDLELRLREAEPERLRRLASRARRTPRGCLRLRRLLLVAQMAAFAARRAVTRRKTGHRGPMARAARRVRR